eukprot:CCRYP_010616-RA/>CCRYP_010616-RA protein AED:0.47 eAED:1.00 QI:0/0/0/1/0/0/2/0/91
MIGISRHTNTTHRILDPSLVKQNHKVARSPSTTQNRSCKPRISTPDAISIIGSSTGWCWDNPSNAVPFGALDLRGPDGPVQMDNAHVLPRL